MELNDIATKKPRSYSISEFAKENAPAYAEQNSVSLEDAIYRLEESMSVFLEWLPIGEKGQFPGTSGYHIRNIDGDRFEILED